ncbi:MAG: hypothetical protein P1U86_08980 [Verrucomicrobiales bacterium]|nr:hypothetical protein [Verrucomicrobiales bacterium]
MKLATIAILVFTFLPLNAFAAKWELSSGTELTGEPVQFNFKTKLVSWKDPITGSFNDVSAEKLSYKTRQRLILSPLIHNSYAGEQLWPKERQAMLFKLFLLAGVFMCAGFWVAGWLIAGKWNPLSASFAFIGSWIVAGIFIVMYLFLNSRVGEGNGVLILGILSAAGFASLFTSAIYGCTFVKGLKIFLFQAVTSICLLFISAFIFELAVPEKTKDKIWTRHIFIPSGLQKATLPDRSFHESS